MKKVQLILTAVFLSVVMSSAALAADKDKIGFVDLSRLFDEYHKTKAYDKTLEAKQKEFEGERNKKIEKIRESQGKLALLTEDKKATLEKDIETMKTALLEYDQQQKQDLTKERNEKIREILLEIEKIVSTYAEKEGFDLILNDRVLIYGNQVKNVTEAILGILNSSAPAEKK